MKFIKGIVVLLLLVVFAVPATAGNNMGVVSDTGRAVGHVAGNGMSWDYALIFKVRGGDAYRALADVEATIAANDTMVAMAAIDGCIIASIKTDADHQQLYSRYARASHLTSLCEVYSPRWTESDQYEDLMFERIRLSAVCR